MKELQSSGRCGLLELVHTVIFLIHLIPHTVKCFTAFVVWRQLEQVPEMIPLFVLNSQIFSNRLVNRSSTECTKHRQSQSEAVSGCGWNLSFVLILWVRVSYIISCKPSVY